MKKIVLLVFVLISFISCNKDDDNTAQENNEPQTFVKTENEIINVGATSITLSGNQSNIDISDIIVSGANNNAPYGFLRKVTSIETVNGNTVLNTSRASIEEAAKYLFEDGDSFEDGFEYTFTSEDENKNQSDKKFETISIDIDETITVDENGNSINIDINGNLTIIPTFESNIMIVKENGLPKFELMFFRATSVNDFNLTLNTEINSTFNTGDIEIGSFTAPPITIFIGSLPIVIVPQFKLYVGSEGEIFANLDYTYQNNSTVSAGIVYNDGWDFVNTNGINVNDESSTATASVTGNINAYVKPEFSLSLYDEDFVSTGIHVKPYARFEGTIINTQYSWEINGGVGTGAFFTANVFGENLADITWDNLIDIPEWEIASGFYNVATITNPSPAIAETITEQPVYFSWQPNDFSETPTFEIFLGVDENSLVSLGSTNETNYTALDTYSNGDFYWKIVATNPNGDFITESNLFSFIINENSNAPTVLTNSTTNITQTSATSGGNVTDDGGSNVIAKGVCWSTSPNPTTSNSTTNEGTGTGSFTSNITGLSPSTTYYVRAYATNSDDTGYGNQEVFTTLADGSIPTVTTNVVTDITQTTATSGGNVTDDGGSNVTAKGVCWSTSPNPTTSNSTTNDGSGIGSFTSSLTGLSPNTTYYVRAYATNSGGTAYGNPEIFTTLANINLPTLTTNPTTNITQTTATSGGNIVNDGGSLVTSRGVCWNTTPNPTLDDNINITNDGTNVGNFTSYLTGLSPSTTYYVRAYATNSVDTGYGNQEVFTTLSDGSLPTVMTNAVTDITQTTATSGGNVTDDGGSNVTARGVCWSTSPNPTTSNNTTNDGTGTGSFTSSLTGLSPNTTYYVRAYATNSEGSGYGNQEVFTTLSDGSLPTVTTNVVTDITQTTATSGGNVTDDGGNNVTSRGVCWSTSPNPTTSNSTTNDGSGTGSFTSSLTGLTASTTYYVRAYATNSEGSGYGNQEVFTTQSGGGGIYEGDVTLTTQQEVDDFGAYNYSGITGFLNINGPINTIDALNTITSIGGDLIIWNGNFQDLNGLNNLSILGGELNIQQCNELNNINEFSNLTSIGGNLTIYINDNLNDINGLNNITSIGGYLYIGESPINDLSSLNSLASLGNDIILINIPITNVDFASNFNQINGDLILNTLPQIENVDGLNSISSISGNLQINNCSSLINIDGLSGINNVGNILRFENNNLLTNLNGLVNILNISSHLYILDNNSISDLCGLQPLLINGGLNGNYNVSGNAYNPTEQDIIDGNCSQ